LEWILSCLYRLIFCRMTVNTVETCQIFE
jgi:hypothetical protein